MPFTVITLKNVPKYLRGDLSKWMQEIAQGVYVGNFNQRAREAIWERVTSSVGVGEATISYTYRNEIGYRFETINSNKQVVDSDGIPLVRIPNDRELKLGFSDAAKLRKAKKMSVKNRCKNIREYVVIDIETSGLDLQEDVIIEFGAVKKSSEKLERFNRLVKIDKKLNKDIIELTGISKELLNSEGVDISEALRDFLEFIADNIVVGYNISFDISFINKELKNLGYYPLQNRRYDLLDFVKREKIFLSSYKLENVLKEYDISYKTLHRAKVDAEVTFELSTKVNEFQEKLKR